MTSIDAKNRPSIQYPDRTVVRAERAVRCAPFQLNLYATMRHQSVLLKAIASRSGMQNRYTQTPLAEFAVENALLWLIQVGMLRREVDGQGITDSFRLTPLGQQLVDKWRVKTKLPDPTLSDRIYNAVNRWFRPPL